MRASSAFQETRLIMETPSVARAAGSPEDNGWIRTKAAALLRMVDDLSLAEKGYGTVGMLAIFTAFLLVMSVQSVRLQISYRTCKRRRPRRRSTSAGSTA